MARELRVTIVGDSTALQAALARASGATAGFAGSIRAAGARLSEAGATLTRGVTLPVVAVGALSAKAAVDFQNAMELIHTQAGVAQGAIAGLSKGVLALAGPTATAPDTLAAGLYHLSSQGLRGANSLKALQIAAEGARMGQANLEDVTNALGAVIASKIGGVHSYEQAMGELNATVGSGDMRMQDLADAMGTGLPAKAAVAGVSLRDVGAALAVFGDNNIRGADAGTLLNSTLRLMEGPSKAAAKAMAQIGLNAGDLGNTLRNNGLVAALELLKSKLDPLSKEDQVLALTRMFGGRQSGGVQVLIDQLGRLKTKEDAVAQGGAGFAKDWATYTKTAAYHLASLGAQMQASGVTIGTMLLPVISELVNKISSAIQWFDGLSASTKKWIMVAAGIAAAVGPALSVLGNLLKVVTALAAPEVLLTTAILALVAALVAAVVWPDKLKEALEKVGLSASQASEVIRVLQTAFSDIKAVVMAVVAVVEAAWARFGDLILAQARTVWNAIKGVIQGALEVIRGIVNVVTGLIHGDWSRVWQGIQQIVQGVWRVIVALVTAELQTLRNEVAAGLRVLSAVMSAVWNDIKSAAVGIWHAIESAVLSVVTSLVNRVVAFFKALVGRIKGAFGDAAGMLVGIGRDIIGGLISGITSAAGGLISKAESIAGSVKGAFKSVLKIFSPSRVMAAEVGVPIVEGIGVGIDQGTPAMTSKAARAATAAVHRAQTAVRDAQSGFVSTFANMANAALQAFDQKVQAWTPPATKLLDKMQTQDQVSGAQRAVDQAQQQLDQAQAALTTADSPAGEQLAALAKNANDAQIALDNLKASGTASKQAIASAQGAYDQAAAALKAFKLSNPDVANSGTDIGQLVDQVNQAQQALTDALRQQKELQLQMEAAEEQKKHDRIQAIQRENLAKQLYELQQALLRHPAEWHKMGVKVEAVLKKFGTTLTPAGQRWSQMFAQGIEQGIPAVQAAAHKLADAVDRYMPHSPAKVGPLSQLPNWGALTEGLDGTVALANGAMHRMTGVATAASGHRAGLTPGGAHHQGGDVVLVLDGEVLARFTRRELTRKGVRNVGIKFGTT